MRRAGSDMDEPHKAPVAKIYRVVCLGVPASTDPPHPAALREARARVIRVCADAGATSAPAVERRS